MQITSTYFQDNDPIPERFSRDKENINPSLTFSEIPNKSKSLVLIMEDPDPEDGTFTHWILYNMPPSVMQIIEGELPVAGKEGINDYGEIGYGGPQPPSGIHMYFFRLYALDNELEFVEPPNRIAINEAMENHVIEEAELMGTYSAK